MTNILKNSTKSIALNIGKTLKTLKTIGNSGTIIPSHHNIEEAVIVVLKSEVKLQVLEKEFLLMEGFSFTIPARKEHKLTIIKDFAAIGVLVVN